MNRINMKSYEYKKQQGWTFWSMTFALATIGFFAFVGMQLVPVYSFNSNIKNAIKVSVRDLDIRKATRSQILLGVSKQLLLDSSQGAVDIRKKLKISRDRNSLTISLKYDRVVHLFANISIKADFHPVLECSFTGGCKEGVIKTELKK